MRIQADDEDALFVVMETLKKPSAGVLSMSDDKSPVTDRANAVPAVAHLSASAASVRSGQDHHVSRATLNFWLDSGLMVLFISLAIVATIVQFVFPPGTGARGWALWGMDFNQWSSLQYGLICAFGFASVIHVMLHWSWVCTIVTRKLLKQTETPDDGIQTILGVGLLIGLLLISALIVGTAMMTIQMPPQ